MRDHSKGLLLTAIGGLALSFDAPLVRLGGGELWATLALRSSSTLVLGLFIWLLVRRFQPTNDALRPGKAGWIAGLFYGLSSIAFLVGLFNTATANVVFIVAFTPMFAALFGWLLLREQPSRSTWITMLLMLAGVGLIVSGGLASGEMLGNLSAVATAALLAAAITTGRKSRANLGLVPLAATVIPAIIGYLLMQPGSIAAIPSPTWVLVDGLVILPLSLWCLATGPKYLSGAEVGMFYLLETVLAPIWMWMIFSEEIHMRVLLGGAILILALVGHAMWQLRSRGQAESITVHSG
jgi:drug/metabolite transporter (DMT)-like permease